MYSTLSFTSLKIYCSGIGGIGLSAYAAFQNASGHKVLGSDASQSAVTNDLAAQGIEVFFRQDGSHVPQDADLFVYSEAIPEDAPERQAAQRYGIRSVSYFAALGELSRGKFVIAVCGTHGKSSTTAMAAKVLIDAGKDPSVIVGTKASFLGNRNWRKGGGDMFLIEACEYRKSFHYLSPKLILVTTVDGDHFDAFPTMESYYDAFVEFFKRLPEGSPIIVHATDAAAVAVIRSSGQRLIDADVEALPSLGIPGEHMRQNGRLVAAGIDDAAARASLQTFPGTWRRMEVKGTRSDGVTIIDDYGHHPAEIRATLLAMREAYPSRRIVCVFQPHTHDRTIKLYDEFTTAFTSCDIVIIPNIYGARAHADSGTVDPATLVHDIAQKSGVTAHYGKNLAETETMLGEMLRPGDVVVCMGAGDITKLADRLLDKR